jgi:hypothetical protein
MARRLFSLLSTLSLLLAGLSWWLSEEALKSGRIDAGVAASAYWMIFAKVFLLLPAIWTTLALLRSVTQRRKTPPRGHCGSCGYDLRATPGRCPECGTAAAAQKA